MNLSEAKQIFTQALQPPSVPLAPDSSGRGVELHHFVRELDAGVSDGELDEWLTATAEDFGKFEARLVERWELVPGKTRDRMQLVRRPPVELTRVRGERSELRWRVSARSGVRG
jgi:hypothetical protein